MLFCSRCSARNVSISISKEEQYQISFPDGVWLKRTRRGRIEKRRKPTRKPSPVILSYPYLRYRRNRIWKGKIAVILFHSCVMQQATRYA